MKHVLLLILLMPLATFSQHDHPACNQVKALTFYAYPRNSSDHYKIVRSQDFQVEYDLKTGDSTVYNVQWDSDCQYSLTYLSSSKKTASRQETLNNIKLVYDIVSVAPTFYVYKIYPDGALPGNMEHSVVSTDTAWLQPVSNPTNTKIFEITKENPATVKRNFKDTSQYALVYLYRLHKLPASESEYHVYFGEDVMFRAMNKTKAIYKIFKEGPVRIHANADNVESLMIDIRFGKKYFIQCQVQQRTSFPAPAITLEELTDGEIGFNSF